MKKIIFIWILTISIFLVLTPIISSNICKDDNIDLLSERNEGKALLGQIFLELDKNLYQSDPIINNYGQDMTLMSSKSGWPQIFDNGPEDLSSSVVVDSDGNIIVTGYSADIENEEINFLTIKYDDDGNEIWNISYDSGINDYGWDLAVDSQDNVIVFGINYSSTEDIMNNDNIIVKYSKDGIKQWNRTFPGKDDNYPGGIAVDSKDNIIITGGSGNLDALAFSCWILKIDRDGNKIWNITYLGEMFSMGADVVVNTNDEIFVGGMYASFFGQGYCIIKYTSTGAKIWTGRYGGNAQPYGMAIDSNENLILTGQTYSEDTNSSSWYTMKSDRDGNLLWTREYDSLNNERGADVTVDSNGNIITVGLFVTELNDVYHCTVIYDENGEETCIKKPGIQGGLEGVVIDNNGKIVVTGTTGSSYNWNFYTDYYLDITPPSVEQDKPKLGYMYLFDKEMIPLFEKTIILGKITVNVAADDPSDIKKVEFYLDKELKDTTDEYPFKWTWNELSFGKHTIETMTYDFNGNIKRNEVIVWKFL
jgi:hypothetical protein